jgi:hypothetical protein
MFDYYDGYHAFAGFMLREQLCGQKVTENLLPAHDHGFTNELHQYCTIFTKQLVCKERSLSAQHLTVR